MEHLISPIEDYYLISPRVREFFEKHAPGAAEYLPIRIEGPGSDRLPRYWAMNFLRVFNCMDDDESINTDARGGKFVAVPVIDPSRVPADGVRVIQTSDPYAAPPPPGINPDVYSYRRADPNGNLIFDSEYFYQYDAWNRLVQVNKRGTLDLIPERRFQPEALGTVPQVADMPSLCSATSPSENRYASGPNGCEAAGRAKVGEREIDQWASFGINLRRRVLAPATAASHAGLRSRIFRRRSGSRAFRCGWRPGRCANCTGMRTRRSGRMS